MIKSLTMALLITGVLGTGVAHAGKANFNTLDADAYTPVFGKTLAPIGYVNFCARNRNECKNIGGNIRAIKLTRQNWDILNQVNKYSNRTTAPLTDAELYDVPEYWTYPKGAGDCEDFVLQKKRYLEGLGFPSETMLITVVLDQKGLGHAVLTVRTDKGDFILDNMRDKIVKWSETGYTFIKRQSQKNPNIWLSLANRGQGVINTTVAGRKRK